MLGKDEQRLDAGEEPGGINESLHGCRKPSGALPAVDSCPASVPVLVTRVVNSTWTRVALRQTTTGLEAVFPKVGQLGVADS